jgi:hypothetical protein
MGMWKMMGLRVGPGGFNRRLALVDRNGLALAAVTGDGKSGTVDRWSLCIANRETSFPVKRGHPRVTRATANTSWLLVYMLPMFAHSGSEGFSFRYRVLNPASTKTHAVK